MKIACVHALERIRQRCIDKELIALCIQKPDKVEALGDVYKCIKRIDDRVIIVVYKLESIQIIVITAYMSSKLHKYLG